MGRREIVWTKTSEKDIQTIFNYISQFSVDSATRIAENIVKSTDILSVEEFSEIGQIDDINPKYRRLIYKNYKILYSIKENYIVINSVFDTRQDPQKLREKK